MAVVSSSKMHRIFVKILFVTAVFMPKQLLAANLQPQVISFLQEAVTGNWHSAKNQGIAAFVCCTDTLTLLRALSSGTSAVRISMPEYWHGTLRKIAAAERKEQLTYILDMTCPGLDELLYKAGKSRLTKIPNRWLFLNVSGPPDLNEKAMTLVSSNDSTENSAACQDQAKFLVQNSPGFKTVTATDSDVTLVCGTTENSVALVDMWGATPLGFWSPKKGFYGDRRPPSVRRFAVGLSKRELKVAFLTTRNDTLDHIDDGINMQHDILTKFNWEVVNNVVNMINGSLALLVSNTFGYKIHGTWTGIIGMQIRGEAEMSGTSLAVVSDRFSVVKYTNFPIPERAPPMSYEHNLFTQPFPRSLWFAAIGIIFLCAIMLFGVLRIEESVGIEVDPSGQSGIPWQVISEGRKRRLRASWSDVALLAFGAVCQQGSPVEARGLTGRIITLFLFIGILFLYTSYSASIVALLQSTSTSIRTYEDLLHTKIALGAESKDYNVYYMKNLEDPLRKKIYEKKIKKNFVTLEEGMKRVREAYFAFHTIRSLMYTEVAQTFQENEKCGLVEVEHFLSLKDPMLAVSNWSEYTELIMLSLRKQLEHGIRNRQIQRFLTPKPVCVNQGGNFQSVALVDCEAAFVVLGMGVGISSLLFFFEKLLFRYHKAFRTLYARAHGK